MSPFQNTPMPSFRIRTTCRFIPWKNRFSLVHCSASKCLCVSAAVQVQLSFGWPFDNNIYILIPIFCRGCTQSVVSNHNAEISSSVNWSQFFKGLDTFQNCMEIRVSKPQESSDSRFVSSFSFPFITRIRYACIVDVGEQSNTAAHQNLTIVTSDKILQGGSVMIVVIVD